MTYGLTASGATAAESVEAIQRRLRSVGVCVMPSADLNRYLAADARAWSRFSAHWEELVEDTYAVELGTQRLRRYGWFSFRQADGVVSVLPHGGFVQPQNSNPLYIARDRFFEPLTDAFAADPLLHRLLQLLARFARVLGDIPAWSVKVHPFRVLASPDREGQPTPEGLHRDGVTLVTTLLVGRRNATGGESLAVDRDGRQLLASTLAEPGTLFVGDDRRIMHGVTSIRPVDPAESARRDVLVITFAPF